MFVYEKQLQYPVKIKRCNPQLAKIIITQYGGPDGELGASLRYLSQRFSMPVQELKATLTDIGCEELNHLEMIGAIVYQLTKDLSEEDIKKNEDSQYRAKAIECINNMIENTHSRQFNYYDIIKNTQFPPLH